MTQETLRGLDTALDSVFQRGQQIQNEINSHLDELESIQHHFFPPRPQDPGDSGPVWPGNVNLRQHFPSPAIPGFLERELERLIKQGAGEDVAALRYLGLSNGDVPTALERVRKELGPHLRMLIRARELHEPELVKAREDALRILSQRAKPKADAAARKMLLAAFKLIEAAEDDLKFRQGLEPGVAAYLPRPPLRVDMLAGPNGVSGIAPYLRLAIREGVIKAVELPKVWRAIVGVQAGNDGPKGDPERSAD